MADATYSPKVYKKDGGDRMVVASGGTVQFESGATLQLDSGSIATLADEILAAGDIALAEGSILVGDGVIGKRRDRRPETGLHLQTARQGHRRRREELR